MGIGQPSADLLPVDLVHAASNRFFESADPLHLNYGAVAGDPEFLPSLASFLTTAYGTPTSTDELFETGGNSQAMDLVSNVFSNPGDTIFVEEPSYFLAFQIFRDHDLNIVGIPIDKDGLSVTALREALKHHNPALLYTIPSYHNPGGQSTTAERRQEIVDLAISHDFMIVADEVYQLLYYYDAPPPAYGTMASTGHVLSLGSFSKILAPAMRLGWVQTSPKLLPKLFANGFVNSGGCINHISAHIVRQAMDSGALGEHIEVLRDAFRSRLETMHNALLEHFSDLATWTKPAGGYFFWLQFDDSVDTGALKKAAAEHETGFQSGRVFSTQGQLNNYLRLSFAHYNEDDIRKGIERLRQLF